MKNLINNSILHKNINIGDFVRFYDCQKANKEHDYSGKNSKYFPIGKVIDIYEYKSNFGYIDKVCDIEIENRISKGHFVRCVELIY